MAVAFNRIEVVEFLLNKGANPYFKDDQGNIAWQVCFNAMSSAKIFNILSTAKLKEHENLGKTNEDLNLQYADLIKINEELIKANLELFKRNEDLTSHLESTNHNIEELKSALDSHPHELTDTFSHP